MNYQIRKKNNKGIVMKEIIEVKDDIHDIKLQIVKIEDKLVYHEKELNELIKWGNKLEGKLEEVVNIMNKVKNWIIGGVVTFVAMQIGIIEFVKALI